MAKQDEWTRLTLRLPPELHERLVEAAKTSSMNAVVVNALGEAFPPSDPIYEAIARLGELRAELRNTTDPGARAELQFSTEVVADEIRLLVRDKRADETELKALKDQDK